MKPRRPQLFFSILTVIITALGGATAHAAPNEPEPTTPQQIFDGMRESFRPEVAKGVHARYQFNFSGPNGGSWFIDVNDGKFKMNRGRIDNPSVTFAASDRDWVAISNGKLNGTWAFITGRLKVRGDRNVARKLGDMFP